MTKREWARRERKVQEQGRKAYLPRPASDRVALNPYSGLVTRLAEAWDAGWREQQAEAGK